MNILILGGNSAEHYRWIRNVKAALESDHHTVIVHDYRHWRTNAPQADIAYEIEQVAAKLSDQSTDWTIIAKSVGTIIATLGISQGRFTAASCIFLGTPIHGTMGSTPIFISSLTNLPYTVFVQNEFDPFGSAVCLKHTLEGVHLTYRYIVVPHNTTHSYTDYTLLEGLLG